MYSPTHKLDQGRSQVHSKDTADHRKRRGSPGCLVRVERSKKTGRTTWIWKNDNMITTGTPAFAAAPLSPDCHVVIYYSRNVDSHGQSVVLFHGLLMSLVLPGLLLRA